MHNPPESRLFALFSQPNLTVVGNTNARQMDGIFRRPYLETVLPTSDAASTNFAVPGSSTTTGSKKKTIIPSGAPFGV